MDENTQWIYENEVAIENATIAEQINTLTTENNTIQEEINTTAQNANTASRNLSTVSAEREAVAIGLETSATTKSSFATRVLIAAKTTLATAQAKLNAVIAANPYAVAIAAIAALSYGIYKLVTYENDFTKAHKDADDAVAKGLGPMQDELNTLDSLKNKLEKAKKGSDEWKEAKNQIISQYGQYFSNLDTEIEKTGTLKTSYEELQKAIRATAAAKAMKAYTDKHDISDDIGDNQKTLQEKLKNVNMVDVNGNIITDNKGNHKKGSISGALLKQIQASFYDYQTGELDVKDMPSKVRAYLEQVGAINREILQSVGGGNYGTVQYLTVEEKGFGNSARESAKINKEMEKKIAYQSVVPQYLRHARSRIRA